MNLAIKTLNTLVKDCKLYFYHESIVEGILTSFLSILLLIHLMNVEWIQDDHLIKLLVDLLLSHLMISVIKLYDHLLYN